MRNGLISAVCGCSSMAEQKLPKLLSFADFLGTDCQSAKKLPTQKLIVQREVSTKTGRKCDGNRTPALTDTMELASHG